RRLVLIRRDNVEHLLIIGGPSDVVVEQNIVRAATVTGPVRVPLGEDSMWPLQPKPASPGAPAPRKARMADPLAELADQLSRVRGGGEPAEQRRPPRLQPAPPARSKADDDQNLSEIAQRLEATLRHPAKGSDDARTAAGHPQTTSGGPRDPMRRRPFRGDEPRAPSEAPKAPSEPAAPPQEPDAQGRGDDKAPSEAAAPPREPDAQGRGDDKAPSDLSSPSGWQDFLRITRPLTRSLSTRRS